jgi:hypothetical protein
MGRQPREVRPAFSTSSTSVQPAFREVVRDADARDPAADDDDARLLAHAPMMEREPRPRSAVGHVQANW